MGAVKDGDLVRVVLEGKADHVATAGFFIGEGTSSNYVMHQAAHTVSVEVLERKPEPLKVGDTLEGQSDYDRAPASTVVRSGTGVLVKQLDGSWHSTEFPNASYRNLNTPRPILYLPPE